jgi:MFS family permease
LTALAEAAASSPTARGTTFSSLRIRNYRLFATGQVFSNTGSWVQRIAQDWLVLTMTGSATAVGITTALQFLPTLLFGLGAGLLADRYPKRRILLTTQLGFALMAATLAFLTLTHRVEIWHVYLIAFGLGIVTAVDSPARQSFVNEMVGPEHLRNAVSLNSSVWQLGGMVGPAITGLLITAFGPGYSFAINSVSYLAPFTALLLIRESELNIAPRTPAGRGQVRAGVRYAVGRPDVLWPTMLVGLLGMFSSNLPVTLASFAKSVFHTGPTGYGLLSAVVAVGSLGGALISARRPRARLRTLLAFAAALAVAEMLSSFAPGQLSFCVVLLGVGASTLLLMTSANSAVQMASPDGIRGRVMGLYLLVFVGSAAIGGPLLGSADQHYGPRVGMLFAGVASAIAVAAIAGRLARLARNQLA